MSVVPEACRANAEVETACERSPRSRSAAASSSVVIAPPSPVVMLFLGWKLKQVKSANVPTFCPPTVAPSDGAASSTTFSPSPCARSMIAGRSAASPIWSTGMIAFVFGVIAASISSGVVLYVFGSMSTKTGLAPACRIAFAEAMNVNDGQITSSPGPTPAATSARCSAVVQFETTIAWRAPVYAASASSNSCTRRPWVSQPERTASAAAAASSSPTTGFVIGMRTGRVVPAVIGGLHSGKRRQRARACDGGSVRACQQVMVPLREQPQAARQHRPRLEPDHLPRLLRAGLPPRDVDDVAGRRVDRLDVRVTGRVAEQRAQVAQAGLDAGPAVEHLVADVRGHRLDVRLGHVLDVDEVHRLEPIPEDDRRLAAAQPLQPADHHLGVGAEDVHPRAVDVERPEHDVLEAVHLVVGAQDLLVGDLRRAVERAVVERVLLVHRQVARVAVDRGRACRRDLLDAVLPGRFEDVLGAVHHHLDRPQRLLGGLGDPQRRLVEDEVAPVRQAIHQRRVADVALDHVDPAGPDGVRDVLMPPPHEVVHDRHVVGAGLDHLVDDERADEAGPAGDENARAAKLDAHLVPLSACRAGLR